MPAIDVLTSRLIAKEDLMLTTTPSPGTVNVLVLGAGTVPVTPLDIVFLGSFTQAVNDAGAAALGVALGQIYYNLTLNALSARLT